MILLGVLFFITFQFLYGRVYAGYSSIIFFSFLYLVAGYIKLFDVPKCLKKHIYLIFIGIWLILVLFATFYNIVAGEFKLTSSAYDGPMFFLSVAAFILVLQKSLDNKWGLFIARIAPYTFGVYLIHENQFVRDFLWEYVIPEHYNYPIILHCAVSCIVVFTICILIDYIRKGLFKIIKINNFVEILSSKMPH